MKMPPGQGSPVHQKEKVAVIGSGIAGCLAAHELASHGYVVTIVEERKTILSGTSANAIQAHLGGFYSASPETARECLHSAIAIKKAMPYSLRDDRNVMFLVADESEISLNEYLSFYQRLTNYYASLPQEDQVFGRPEHFFRVLSPREYSFAKNVQGGIATQEPALDMVRIRSVLLRQLRQLGVRFAAGTEVVEATQTHGRFTLQLKKGAQIEPVPFDQVVNAGGYKAYELDYEFGDKTRYNLYLKAWNIVRDHSAQPLPSFYVVQGGFIHYAPIGDDGLASLFASIEGASYMGKALYDRDHPNLPPRWAEILKTGKIPDGTERQVASLAFARERFLRDPQLELVDIIPGIAVSYSHRLEDRTRRGPNIVLPGWQTIVPTKATNALELAREALQNALIHSQS